MNGVSREDVETIARLAAAETAAKVMATIDARIDRHQAQCPVASMMEVKLYKLLLMLVASGALGGGFVGAVLKLF